MSCILCGKPAAFQYATDRDLTFCSELCGKRFWFRRKPGKYKKIAYALGGGLGGGVQRYGSYNVRDLPAKQRKKLVQLLDEANFTSMPPRLPRQGFDTPLHIVTVTLGEGDRQLTVSGDNLYTREAYPKWNELVRFVRKIFLGE